MRRPSLLPYPRSRQLVFFSAMPEGGYTTPPSPPPSSNATLLPGGHHYPITKESPWLLHVAAASCMDAPPPLASELDGCTQLRGQSATEEILAAVADEVSGSAYLGCKSGTALRLSLKPVRVEERVAAGSPITGALLRPQDGTLWLSSEGGELLQLSTRQAAGTGTSQAAATSGTPQPTWFRGRGCHSARRQEERTTRHLRRTLRRRLCRRRHRLLRTSELSRSFSTQSTFGHITSSATAPLLCSLS